MIVADANAAFSAALQQPWTALYAKLIALVLSLPPFISVIWRASPAPALDPVTVAEHGCGAVDMISLSG